MKTHHMLYILSCFFTAFFVSCSSGSGDEPNPNGSEDEGSPQNRILNGTKWTTRNWDFDISDDSSWAYIWSDITNVYFYSNSEGLFYYSRKTLDSDNGRSRSTEYCFFRYSVNGDIVEFDLLTPKVFGFPSSMEMEIKNGGLVYGGEIMNKNIIDTSDIRWINGKKGNAGSLNWYYGSQGTLVVKGQGEIPDYTHYRYTPWAEKTVNSVIISEGVTKVGAYAFADVSIGKVEFEKNTITEIGPHAFNGASMSEVRLPNSIKIIKADAFLNCKYATVYLPKEIEIIESGAFSNCKKALLVYTPNLRVIGDNAFSGANVDAWTNSTVLESIGNGCFITYNGRTINLPAITKLGNIAVSGKALSEIHIGNGLSDVVGTPFFGSKTGKLYIARTEPLDLTRDIVDNVSGWTLYVPQGCEKVYRNSPFWANFKSIVGSSDLGIADGGSEDSDDDTEGVITFDNAEAGIFDVTLNGEINGLPTSKYDFYFEICNDRDFGSNIYSFNATIKGKSLSCYIEDLEPNTGYYYRVMAKYGSSWISGNIYYFETQPSNIPSSCSYTLDGVQYNMVKVTGLNSGDFYIMQTELPPSAIFVLNNTPINRYMLDSNDDNVIIKTEFRNFLREIREKTGIALRLPTKSEWQYAAKGGQFSKGFKYSGSDDIKSVAWYNKTYLHDPAKLEPNELGLYDMSGNYAEVVNDISDIYNVDGDLCGGNINSAAAACTPMSFTPGLKSGNVVGTRFKEKNAFNAKLNTIRLVYSAE